MAQHSGKELDDMSLTRGQLKSIVKECLLEILSEGIGTTPMLENKSRLPMTNTTKFSQSKVPTLKPKIPSASLKETVRREAGGDPILESILADTAEKTLPSMLENDRARVPVPAGGVAERLVASHDPSELFGEDATSKWADLAFMSSSKKAL